MISWDLLKRVYGFVGEFPNPEKMDQITYSLRYRSSFNALMRYIERQPLDDIAKSIGMILPKENQSDFFLDNLRYYDDIALKAVFSEERLLCCESIEDCLGVYKDDVLLSYYKGDYKSRPELVRLCSEELEKKVKASLPINQSSLYLDKRVIRIKTEGGPIWYKVKELCSLLSKNSGFLPEDTKEQLLQCISNRFIQWGYTEEGLVELQEILLH